MTTCGDRQPPVCCVCVGVFMFVVLPVSFVFLFVFVFGSFVLFRAVCVLRQRLLPQRAAVSNKSY